MRNDFLLNNKRDNKMCVDKFDIIPQLFVPEQQQIDKQEIDSVSVSIKDESQILKQTKKTNVKSRKSLQLNGIDNYEMSNEMNLDKKIEQLDKKLQILNDTNIKIQSPSSLNINLTSDSNDESDTNSDDTLMDYIIPKKSCLVVRSTSTDLNINLSTSSSCSSISSPTSSLNSSDDEGDNDVIINKVEFFQNDAHKMKKRVTFADFHGKELIHIKHMTEPSDCPPRIQSKSAMFFLDKEFYSNYYDVDSDDCQNQQELNNVNKSVNLIQKPNDKQDNTQCITQQNTKKLNIKNANNIVYTLNFEQPAGDYLVFQEKLKNNNVSLENVILNRLHVSGTIKVKNVCYNKQVFIRCTFDNWSTYTDYHAQYVPNTFQSGFNSITSQNMKSLIDTFKFEFDLPNKRNPNDPVVNIHIDLNKLNSLQQFHQSTYHHTTSTNQQHTPIQFCVCFRTDDGHEYWDNNMNKNYSIIKYVLDLNVNLNDTTNRQTSKSTALNTNANYLQLLIQEQHLNTLIDNYFYNLVYNNRHLTTNSTSKLANISNKSNKSCSADSLLWQNHNLDCNIPYW